MTKRELEAEVQRLRDEVLLLKAQQLAHVCPPPYLTWPYGGVYVGDVPPCQPSWYFPTNVCAGAAGMPQTVMVKPGQEYTVTGFVTTGCAAGVPPMLTFNVPA